MDANKFVLMVAGLTRGGECPDCGMDGDVVNAACEQHRACEVDGDDAVDSLGKLIWFAREIRDEASNLVRARDARHASTEVKDGQ
jgi:hypothetical protein